MTKNFLFVLLWFWIMACYLRPAVAQQPFEQVGTFVGRGSQTSQLVGPGPKGTERLYAVYAYAANMNLVAYDPLTGLYTSWPSTEGGAKAMALGPDSQLYLGTYFKAHVMRLNPQNGQFDDLGIAVPGETTVWELSLGNDGKLYGGTSLNAKLFSLDPATSNYTNYGRMDPTERYLRTLCAAPDGWVYCGIGYQKDNIVAFNPQTKEMRSLIPDSERQPGLGFVMRGQDGNAYGSCNGKKYSLLNGAATVISSLPAPMPTLRLKNGTTAVVPNTYSGSALPIYLICAGPDGKIYGSGYEGEDFLCYDPISQKRTVIGRLPGLEAYSYLAAGGKIYIASYPDAALQVYDPSRPFHPGSTPTDNPINYGPVASNQDRPFAMTQAQDGKIYIACVPADGRHGGALAWFDPNTNTLSQTAEPVKAHGLTSVCALPGGLIACGSSSRGGLGTTARSKTGVLFLWNPAKQKKAFQCEPVADEPVVRNLTLGGDGLIYGSAGRKVFAFDPASRTVMSQTTLLQGTVLARKGMLRLDDGRVVALAGSSAVLVTYAAGKWQVREFARNQERLTSGAAASGGYLYAVSGDEQQLVRCAIPAN